MARRSLFIAGVTALVDLMTVTVSYAAARAAWPWHRLPDLGLLPSMNPFLLATIPCWLVVFFAFGLYSHKYLLDAKATIIPRLLNAVIASIFVIIVVAFAFNIDMHRGWVVVLWVVATVLVVMGRLVIRELTQRLNQAHWLGPA